MGVSTDDQYVDHLVTVFYQTKEIAVSLASHWLTKAILSQVAAFFALMLGRENYQVIFLLGILIIIDLITGMMSSVYNGEPIESRRAFKSATKTVVYLLFFSAAYLTHKIVPYSDFIKTGVLSFLALTELLSVMENLSKMGYAIPAKLLNQMKARLNDPTGIDEQISSYGTDNK